MTQPLPPDERSETLINDALAILDASDQCEAALRGGQEVHLGEQHLRGEDGLVRVEDYRSSAVFPLLAAAAVNLDRIATALEGLADHQPGSLADLDRFADGELLAALADRAARRTPDTPS